MIARAALALLVRTQLGRDLTRPLWSRLSRERVERLFRTPALINAYMQASFRYVHDIDAHGLAEHWHLPSWTFASRRGDCEDWALFAWQVLRRNGIEAHVFCAFTASEGHAVCLARDARGYVSIANEGLRRVASGAEISMTQLARAAAAVLYPDGWESCSFVERLTFDQHDGKHAIRPCFDWIYPP